MTRVISPYGDIFNVKQNSKVSVYFEDMDSSNIKINGEWAVRDNSLCEPWRLASKESNVWSLRGDFRLGHNIVQAWDGNSRIEPYHFFYKPRIHKAVVNNDTDREVCVNLPAALFGKTILKDNYFYSITSDHVAFCCDGKIAVWKYDGRVVDFQLCNDYAVVNIDDRIYWLSMPGVFSPYQVSNKIQGFWNEIDPGGGYNKVLGQDFVLFWNDISMVGYKNFFSENPITMLWESDDLGQEINSCRVVGDIAIVNNSIFVDVCYPKIC